MLSCITASEYNRWISSYRQLSPKVKSQGQMSPKSNYLGEGNVMNIPTSLHQFLISWFKKKVFAKKNQPRDTDR